MKSTFFSGKRPWSRIKDQILGQYMPPYLAKVAKLGKPIILIDAFAGPGKFDDHSPGSPLIICQAARKHVPNNSYLAIFVNRQKDHHLQLSHVISGFTKKKNALPIYGSADELLVRVRDVLADHTVFLYLDPFGLKGCEFSVIEPFLRRNKSFSTEIMINLNIPAIHRLATRRAVLAGRSNEPMIQAFHKRLTDVLGGQYWKEILWDGALDPETQAEMVMAVYREKMLSLDTPQAFSGSCPVRERKDGRIKYYVTFYSRHRDAMLLMNDIMCTAYQQRMYEAWTDGTLFTDTNWHESRDLNELEGIILNTTRKVPYQSRFELWANIVQNSFMRFTSSEYKNAVAKLVKNRELSYKDVKGTKRLNDLAQLYIPSNHSP